MSNTDGLPTISKRLSEIFGDAEDAYDRADAVLNYLKDDGRKYIKTANEVKAEKMSFLAGLAKELEQAHVLQVTCDKLRKKLKRHNGTGERRKHSRQNFYALAFQAFYGMAKSTAAQSSKVVQVLLKEAVKPHDFVKEVKRRGLEGIAPSKKRKPTTSSSDEVQEAPTGKATLATSSKREAVRALPGKGNRVSAGYKGSAPSECETDGFVVSIPDLVAEGCAGLGKGVHLILGALENTENGGTITAIAPFTRGHSLRRAMMGQLRLKAFKVFGTLPTQLSEEAEEAVHRKKPAA